MFKRRAERQSKEHRKDDFDPFGVTLDPDQLKFDESALEKELAAILDSDEESEVPETSHVKVRLQTTSASSLD